MVRRKHFLIDRQGALAERFRLFIAPLILIELCQVIKGGCDVGMVRREHSLVDRQGTLIERLSLHILCMVFQVPRNKIEELSRFWEAEPIEFNKGRAGEGMGQIALAALPGIELHFWKSGF